MRLQMVQNAAAMIDYRQTKVRPHLAYSYFPKLVTSQI